MESSRKRKPKLVALVSCQGGYRAKSKLTLDKDNINCRQAAENYTDGVLECSHGCLGFGSCVSACRLGAIDINSYGAAEVDTRICVGCGLCVKACPKELIHMIKPESTIMPRCSNHDKGGVAKMVCSVSCIACKICEKNCPVNAISVVEDCAAINQDVCITCGMCAVGCPRHVIVDTDGIFSVNI